MLGCQWVGQKVDREEGRAIEYLIARALEQLGGVVRLAAYPCLPGFDVYCA